MASRRTTPAGSRFLIVDRKLPFSEGHTVTNVFRVVRGMCIVARPARAPLHRSVHMDVVQVMVAVSEIRQRRGHFITGDGVFVTHEAEFVIVRVV